MRAQSVRPFERNRSSCNRFDRLAVPLVWTEPNDVLVEPRLVSRRPFQRPPRRSCCLPYRHQQPPTSFAHLCRPHRRQRRAKKHNESIEIEAREEENKIGSETSTRTSDLTNEKKTTRGRHPGERGWTHNCLLIGCHRLFTKLHLPRGSFHVPPLERFRPRPPPYVHHHHLLHHRLNQLTSHFLCLLSC